jgi:hypothetical protein
MIEIVAKYPSDMTFQVCLSKDTLAALQPPTPVAANDSGNTILVVFALIAQLVVNVIAIRKPARGKS